MLGAKIWKLFRDITIKTIVFNFKYLKFTQAIKLPIFISNHVYLKNLKGRVILEGDIRPGRIQIGYGNVGIFDDKKSRSVLDIHGTIVFKGSAKIGHGSKISVGIGGLLTIGDVFKISAETSIIASKAVTIGDNCLFSWETLVMDTDFHDIRNINGDIINHPKEIIIGNNVWIGCRCLLLKGSNIPNNSVVAANSVISTKIEGENKIFGGNPVKILKSDVFWEN